MATKPRAAKDVKAGSSRAEFLEKAKGRKPRPAKDVKPGSLREKALKRPDKTGVSGTSTEARRIADAKKPRGPFGQLTVRKENMPAKVEEPKRGVVKYEEPKRGVVKYEEPKRGVATRPGAAGVAGRSLSTVAGRMIGGPVTMLIAQTKPAGEGSDKPTGPLMKGGKQPGYKYLEEPARGGGPEKRQGSSAPYAKRDFQTIRGGHGVPGYVTDRSPGYGGKLDKPSPSSPKPPVPKARPVSADAKKAEPKKFAPKKVEAPAKAAPKKPTFSGNWTGAAPTAMQARAGKKVSGRRTFGRDR